MRNVTDNLTTLEELLVQMDQSARNPEASALEMFTLQGKFDEATRRVKESWGTLLRERHPASVEDRGYIG